MATDKLVDFDHVTDYISREAAISEILSEPTEAHYPSWYAEKLKQVPAADVVEVVSCRECRDWDGNKCTSIYGLLAAKPNDYCSRGVK